MSYFPKPSLNENDLAIIERGDTAAHSIDAGQYVSWHGKTGKAKAAILQGATLDDTLFDYYEDGILNANRIRYGIESFSVGSSGGEFSRHVAFSPPFPSNAVPSVVATINDPARGYGASGPASAVGANSITYTGFTLLLKSGNITSGTLSVSWIAYW